MTAEPTVAYFSSVGEEGLKEHHLAIIEMLKAQIEAGNVQSLLVIFAADKAQDQTAYGGRHLIRPRHMDFLEDAFMAAMQHITDETGCTAQKMREARAEALERSKTENQ